MFYRQVKLKDFANDNLKFSGSYHTKFWSYENIENKFNFRFYYYQKYKLTYFLISNQVLLQLCHFIVQNKQEHSISFSGSRVHWYLWLCGGPFTDLGREGVSIRTCRSCPCWNVEPLGPHWDHNSLQLSCCCLWMEQRHCSCVWQHHGLEGCPHHTLD